MARPDIWLDAIAFQRLCISIKTYHFEVKIAANNPSKESQGVRTPHRLLHTASITHY